MAFWRLVCADLSHLGDPGTLAALVQVVLIDVMLAADNAIVVGAIAGGFDPARRRRILLVGIGLALVLRMAFALAATALLRVPGLAQLGGVLLLSVAWRMWKEMRGSEGEASPGAAAADTGFLRAVAAIAIADFSMSLDNALGVAGAARAHPGVLIVGLGLSVALMGGLAAALAALIQRYRWLSYVGLAAILFVAVRMIAEPWVQHLAFW